MNVTDKTTKNRPQSTKYNGITNHNGLIIGTIFVVCLSVVVLLWRLVSISSDKISKLEMITKHQLFIDSPWWKSLAFFYGPYYFLLHGVYAIHRNLYFFRLLSILPALAAALLVYWVVSRYHGYKIAILASSLFITNYAVLIVSRIASPLSTQLLPIVLLIAIGLYLEQHNVKIYLLLAMEIAIIGCLYIPGMLFIIATILALNTKLLSKTITSRSFKDKVIVSAIALLSAGPLIYRLAAHYTNSQLLNWLGYDLHGTILNTISSLGINLKNVVLDLFIHSSKLNSSISLGHLPLITVVQTIMIAIGIYYYSSRRTNVRWRNLLIVLISTWLIIGFGVISVYSLLPLTSVISGTGLAYLLNEWHKRFPSNLVAKYLGILISSSVVILVCILSLRTYFVAWAYNPNTKQDYSHKLSP